MARLIDARAAVDLDPVVGGVMVIEFSDELAGRPRETDGLPAAPIGRGGARLDRSVELVDWFDVIAG